MMRDVISARDCPAGKLRAHCAIALAYNEHSCGYSSSSFMTACFISSCKYLENLRRGFCTIVLHYFSKDHGLCKQHTHNGNIAVHAQYLATSCLSTWPKLINSPRNSLVCLPSLSQDTVKPRSQIQNLLPP